MLKNKKLSKLNYLLIICMISLSFIVVTPVTSFSNSLDPVIPLISQNYIEHDPISITNDSELAVLAVNGTGVVNDPFIITHLNITGSSSHGIYITGTTKHFRIETCWISDSVISGIYIVNVTTGTASLINNTCNNNGDAGIFLWGLKSSLIANNTCSNNIELGIGLQRSDNATLINNCCCNNGEVNFASYEIEYIGKSNLYTQIFHNIINDHPYRKDAGIVVWNSAFSLLENNYCSNNGMSGIYFFKSPSSVIINNTCVKNGGFGMFLSNSKYSNLTSNVCKKIDWAGIMLYRSDFSNLTNNLCHENTIGIYLFFSDLLQLVNNFCSHNSDNGILTESFRYSLLANNTCNNNGIGIFLQGAWRSNISNNVCFNNRNGIALTSYSTENIVSLNELCENGYGVSLNSNVENNIISFNIFINNSGISQANDDGNDNKWEENFWSDYTGSGCYYIAGSARALDRHPAFIGGNHNSCSSIPAFTYIVVLLSFGFWLFRIRSKRSM